MTATITQQWYKFLGSLFKPLGYTPFLQFPRVSTLFQDQRALVLKVMGWIYPEGFAFIHRGKKGVSALSLLAQNLHIISCKWWRYHVRITSWSPFPALPGKKNCSKSNPVTCSEDRHLSIEVSMEDVDIPCQVGDRLIEDSINHWASDRGLVYDSARFSS